MKRLILASGSPRRKKIFEDLGLDFEIIKSPYEEVLDNHNFTYEKIENLAYNKAYEVAKNIKDDAIVVGADTIVVLDNQKIEVMNDSDSIDIIGLADTSFIESDWLEYGGNAETKNLLNTLTEGTTNFKILLSHRPELFDIYSNSNVNLIFSGHAHGGQFRLPFIGGLIAPDQGFFPKLTEGIHTSNDTSMIISRGLGNSIIPVRILNRPELIVVTLSK